MKGFPLTISFPKQPFRGQKIGIPFSDSVQPGQKEAIWFSQIPTIFFLGIMG